MKLNNETNINNINYIRYMENKSKDGETKRHTEKEQTTTERK